MCPKRRIRGRCPGPTWRDSKFTETGRKRRNSFGKRGLFTKSPWVPNPFTQAVHPLQTRGEPFGDKKNDFPKGTAQPRFPPALSWLDHGARAAHGEDEDGSCFQHSLHRPCSRDAPGPRLPGWWFRGQRSAAARLVIRQALRGDRMRGSVKRKSYSVPFYCIF